MSNYTDVACVVSVNTKDTLGADADATTLKAYVRAPGRGEVIYTQGTNGTWTHPSTGNYTFSFTPDIPGQWRIGFTAVAASWTSTAGAVVDVTTLRPFD